MLLAQTFDLDANLLDIFLNYKVAGPQFLPLAVGRFIAHLSSIRDLLVLLVASTLFYRFPSFKLREGERCQQGYAALSGRQPSPQEDCHAQRLCNRYPPVVS